MANRNVRERTEGGQYVKEETRRPRVSFGGHRTKLQLSKVDQEYFEKRGEVVRWFNDLDGRIQRAEAGWWRFVQRDEITSIGQGALHRDNSDLGELVSVVASRGEPSYRAYLMAIKKELYDEDQIAKESVNARVDEALRATNKGGQTIDHGYTPA